MSKLSKTICMGSEKGLYQALQRRVRHGIGYQNTFAMHKVNATIAPIT